MQYQNEMYMYVYTGYPPKKYMYENEKTYFTSKDEQKVPQLSPSHDYQNQVRNDVGKLGFQWSSPLITTVGSSLDSIGIVPNRKWIFLA